MTPSIKDVDGRSGHQSRNDRTLEDTLPSCALAVGFLLSQQSDDGAWRDFHLKPGRSDAWVTAYVGSRLLQVARHRSGSDVNSALDAAVRFLESARHKQGGWGYNTRCEPDADSTAQTILFLRKAGQHVPLRDYSALARFQLDDGAFATYKVTDPQHGWGHGHPEVTIVALRALAGILPADHVILRRGNACVAEYLNRSTPTESYWWPSHFYMARELLLLQRENGNAPKYSLPQLRLPGNASCFEQALALEVSLLSGSGPAQLSASARRFGSLQCSDGSWPSAPILRVTDPRSRTIDDRYSRLSHIASDDRRLFTTATVLAALDSLQMVTDGRVA